jgi:hypothetical protein
MLPELSDRELPEPLYCGGKATRLQVGSVSDRTRHYPKSLQMVARIFLHVRSNIDGLLCHAACRHQFCAEFLPCIARLGRRKAQLFVVITEGSAKGR